MIYNFTLVVVLEIILLEKKWNQNSFLILDIINRG